MTDNSLNITIVDDDPDFCASLQGLLEMAGHNVKLFQSGMEFLKTNLDLIDGCILLDVRMPLKDGITVLQEALEINPKLYIILMSGHGDIPMAVKALKLGARDFIEKPFTAALLFDALETFAKLRKTLSDQDRFEIEAKAKVGHLSPRELDVTEKLTEGKSNKIMAFELGISVRTVEVHRANVMLKLQARSLADLIKIYLAATRI